MKKNIIFLVTIILIANIFQTNSFAVRIYKERRYYPTRTNVILNNKNDVLQLLRYINDYYGINGRPRYGRSLPVDDNIDQEDYQDDENQSDDYNNEIYHNSYEYK